MIVRGIVTTIEVIPRDAISTLSQEMMITTEVIITHEMPRPEMTAKTKIVIVVRGTSMKDVTIGIMGAEMTIAIVIAAIIKTMTAITTTLTGAALARVSINLTLSGMTLVEEIIVKTPTERTHMRMITMKTHTRMTVIMIRGATISLSEEEAHEVEAVVVVVAVVVGEAGDVAAVAAGEEAEDAEEEAEVGEADDMVICKLVAI